MSNTLRNDWASMAAIQATYDEALRRARDFLKRTEGQ